MKQKSKKFVINGGTRGIIYPDHPRGEHTIAKIIMNGTYPVAGYSINQKCSETILMLSGIFRVRTNNTIREIRPGDILVILPKTKYRVEGRGEALDIITPAWDKKQNNIVPDKSFTIRP
ncbi:MAG: hypothetical protein HY434_02795 [Candidatus Liptonbacteria bacterium]|nr:hypothetical protein [Candidatus Liptonbacteria bacterium]